MDELKRTVVRYLNWMIVCENITVQNPDIRRLSPTEVIMPLTSFDFMSMLSDYQTRGLQQNPPHNHTSDSVILGEEGIRGYFGHGVFNLNKVMRK